MIFYLVTYILGLGSCVYGLCKLLSLNKITWTDLWFYPLMSICGLIVAITSIFIGHLP
jgi:hypothetical protein